LHDVDWGAVKSIKFGAKYTDHDRELRFNATTYGGFHMPINTTPSSAFAGGLTPSDFLGDIKSAGTVDAYWQINRDAVSDILFGQLANTTRVLYPQQSFAVNETAYAGFAMVNFDGGNWRGNAGLRYVRTEQTSSGYVVSPNGSIPNPYGNYDPLTVERTYNDWLPSFNVAYDMSDSMILRFSAAKVMARPDFTDIAPRASLNPGALSGNSGNPNLDPYRANQADLSLEWYPSPNTSFAAGLYYKDIKSFITDAPTVQNFPVQSATSPNLACTPLGPNLFNCPFTLNQRTTGGGGRIQGFELTATTPIWGPLGVQANYTFADAEADSGDPIPGASKDAFNLQLYYETKRMSARLAYTYRSDWFVAFDRSTRLNQKAFDQVDAQLTFNLTDQVQLSLEGQNLLNEHTIQYATETYRPRAIYDNGRIYFAGVRVKF
jgi:iron complex outermembrane receptor protein